MLRSIYRLCFGIVLAGLASTSMAKPTINILSWWGYFENQDLLELIENECEVEISVDNYYSSGEFIRRLRSAKNGYDIVVFSNTIYNVVRDDILRKEAILINEVVQDYNDVVKEQYNQCAYPSNVCYFTHGVTGFLWNTENIKISEKDRLKTIFENAGEQTVVLIDDEVELTELVMKGIEENIDTREDFLKMSQEDFRSLTLKGGTAINLFIRDMPRLSVDIDLTFLPILERKESLAMINEKMRSIAKRLNAGIAQSKAELIYTNDGICRNLQLSVKQAYIT